VIQLRPAAARGGNFALVTPAAYKRVCCTFSHVVASCCTMPSSWSELCTQAEKQELQALLTNLYAIGGVLVRAAHALQLAFRALSRNHALIAMCLMHSRACSSCLLSCAPSPRAPPCGAGENVAKKKNGEGGSCTCSTPSPTVFM